MTVNATLSHIILILAAAALLYAALTDLRQYEIRNEIILVLTLLFFVHALVSGRWMSVPWNVGFALALLIVLLYFFSQNLLGGGDVKLLAVALLWAGPDCALPFAVLLLIFATLHTGAAKLGWVGTQQLDDDARARIPFAPSVAAALIGTFMLGCLQPMA
jgi:prepilin peptidase CpaA